MLLEDSIEEGEQIKVKMVVVDDGMLSEIIVRGDGEQVEKMRKELKLSERGMVYVNCKGSLREIMNYNIYQQNQPPTSIFHGIETYSLFNAHLGCRKMEI